MRLTLNRPDARNALSLELMRQLMTQLESMAHDDEVRVVILSRRRPLPSARDMTSRRCAPIRRPIFYSKVFGLAGRLMLTITDFPRPVIAEVQGHCDGGRLPAGRDRAILAIAADDARFATPGVNIGLFCSTPMVALSRAVAPKHAMEMLLTGDMIGAEEA